VTKEPILDEGEPILKGIRNWRASKTGGHPKLDEGQLFLGPTSAKLKIDTGPKCTQE